MFFLDSSLTLAKNSAIAHDERVGAVQSIQTEINSAEQSPDLDPASIVLAQGSAATGIALVFGLVMGIAVGGIFMPAIVMRVVSKLRVILESLLSESANPSRIYSVEVEVADGEAARTEDCYRINVRAVVSVGFKNPNTRVGLFYHEGELLIEKLEDTVRLGAIATIAAAVSQKKMEHLSISELQGMLDPDANNSRDPVVAQVVRKEISKMSADDREFEVASQVSIVGPLKDLPAGSDSGKVISSYSRKPIENLRDHLERFNLELKQVLIVGIEENNYYDPNNYFDAKALQQRSLHISNGLQERRKNEIYGECEIEKLETRLRTQQLSSAREIERQKIEREIEREKQQLEKQKEIETTKIAQEEEIEKKRISAQDALSDKQKELHENQVGRAIASSKAELKRLEEEKAKVEIEEKLNSTIAVLREERSVSLAKLEAERMKVLADMKKVQLEKEAEGKTALASAVNAFERRSQVYQLIVELIPILLEKMPELGEVLSPQSGETGDTRIYAFSSDDKNADDLNKLLLSTSDLSWLAAHTESGHFMKFLTKVFSVDGARPGDD